MPIPGDAEPGVVSVQQELQLQQSVYLSNAIPIKKRRFPVIRSSSPPPEEKCSKQESNTPDQRLSSHGNSDMSKISAILERNEEVASTNVLLGQHYLENIASKLPNEEFSGSGERTTHNSEMNKASSFMVKNEEVTSSNVDIPQASTENILASKLLGAKPSSESGLRTKLNILPDEKPAEPRVLANSVSAKTKNVKHEIVIEQVEGASIVQQSTLCPMNAMSPMTVELSLGLNEPPAPILGRQLSGSIHHKSEMSDPSLLSLSSTKEKHAFPYNNESTTGSVNSLLCANRSNWDLNTTMDAWEGSSKTAALAQRFIDIGRFSKVDICSDAKSSLTTTGIDGFSSDKAKHNLNDKRPITCYASVQSHHQFTTDDSLGLRLAMPFRELGASRERFTLLNKLAPTTASQPSNMPLVQFSPGNVNMSVKSESVDENLSIGSSCSSNMGLLKISSVKREPGNDRSLGTALQSSGSPEKLGGHKEIISEVSEQGNKETNISDDTILPQSVARVMHQQESCASSSALPVPLMLQNPCPPKLPTYSGPTAIGDLSNQPEKSFHSIKFHDHNDKCNENVTNVVSKPFGQVDKCLEFKAGVPNPGDPESFNLAHVDDCTLEFCQSDGVAPNLEEKMMIPTEMSEGVPLGSYCQSKENCAIEISKVIGKNVSDKEDAEYEDGEVRESMQHSAGEDPILLGKKSANLASVNLEPQNLQSFVLPGDKKMNAPDLEEKFTAEENHDGIHSGSIKDGSSISCEPKCENISLIEKPDNSLEVEINEKRSGNASPDRMPVVSGREDVENNPAEKDFSDEPNYGSYGIDTELCDGATEKVVEDICSGENASTLAKIETPLNGHDTENKESNSAGGKSRIISLPRTPLTTPVQTRSITNKLPTPRSGKERYSDIDGKIQPRENRDGIYTGGPNKFRKDRMHDPLLRNSRSSFILGKRRVPGRFGSLRSEWDSGHEFVSKNYNGPPDYQVRCKHSSNISDVELECSGYGFSQDDTALVGGRRKVVNDNFPSIPPNSLRRLPPGDRDDTVPRAIQMMRRIPRNMSPNRCIVEDGSDVGHRHGDKFMRHLSDDMAEAMYSLPQDMYDNLDGQLVQGNRNFSTKHRKGFPQSKSPVGFRARSPDLWLSPRRRSPNGIPEFSEHRSPGMYRMGRMRSPERACYRNEIVARRRESPSYIVRHANELGEVGSGREHVHPRPTNSNRRTSPGQVFPRNNRRAEALDSREMGEGNEYINGPPHSNKFRDLHIDESNDERRKFIERRGPPRSFRPNYRGDNDNFHFHQNDGARPYRFCSDVDPEFVERSNMRERELEAHIKNHSMVAPRRIRNIEDQPDSNYQPPSERVWHDNGFTDSRVKRRRF